MSCDIIKIILPFLNNPFIIVDEFHNLSKNNIYNNSDPLNYIIYFDTKTLYMSATPRIYELEDNDDCDVNEILGKTVYKMDFKEAISKKYICDYDIYLPILEDESLENLEGELANIKAEINDNLDDNSLSKKCCYLFECIKRFGTLKCIIYFQSHKDITSFTKCFNKINEYYAYDYEINSIICDDSKEERNTKIESFKICESSSFLCAVNILDECIDIPECNSVYVTYNCKSKIKNIQRMSRSMRLDKTNSNKRAKIILWCDEIADILTFMSSIKEIDLNFNEKIKFVGWQKEMIKSHMLGGNSKKYEDKYMKQIVGIKEYRGFNWFNMLNKVEKFITTKNKRPSRSSKDNDEKIMGLWISRQQCNYRTKSQIMANQKFRERWSNFIELYKNYLDCEDYWYYTFNELEQYLIKKKKRPSAKSHDKEEQIMARWLENQMCNYKTKMYNMKNQKIYDAWTEFIGKYNEYVMNYIERWYFMCIKVEKYIIDNNKRPSIKSHYKEEKSFGTWLSNQLRNYRKKKDIMKNPEIYEEFRIFIQQYKEFIVDNTTNWYNTLNEVDKFIINKHKKPYMKSKNGEEKRLGIWVNVQQLNYKKKSQIMANQTIYDHWTQFVQKHKELLLDNENYWYFMLDKLEKYIKINHKNPPSKPKNEEEKILRKWFDHQRYNYKNKLQIMVNQTIYNRWTIFLETTMKIID